MCKNRLATLDVEVSSTTTFVGDVIHGLSCTGVELQALLLVFGDSQHSQNKVSRHTARYNYTYYRVYYPTTVHTMDLTDLELQILCKEHSNCTCNYLGCYLALSVALSLPAPPRGMCR